MGESMKNLVTRPWGSVPVSQPSFSRREPVRSGGPVPSDDDLLERTLAFSGSYVSDDGHVTIRRAPGRAEYSGARFVGFCTVCSRSRLLPPGGERLADLRAAVDFLTEHTHGEAD